MYCIQFLATLHLFLRLLQMSNSLNTSFFLYYAFITVVTGDFYTKGTHWCPFLPEHYNSFFLFCFWSLVFCLCQTQKVHMPAATLPHSTPEVWCICVVFHREVGIHTSYKALELLLFQKYLSSCRPLFLLNPILSASKILSLPSQIKQQLLQ